MGLKSIRFLAQTIRGGEDASVESIAWHGNRLFAGGLHSTVTEWDLDTLLPKASVDSFGGPVWAIAVNNAGTMLAVSDDAFLFPTPRFL